MKLASLSLIIISLFLPVFFGSGMRGIQALSFGWISFYTGDFIPSLVWMSSPLLFLSLIISPKRRRLRFILSGFSFSLALIGVFIVRVPKDDYIHYVQVAPGFGYIAWVIGIAGIYFYHRERFRSGQK